MGNHYFRSFLYQPQAKYMITELSFLAITFPWRWHVCVWTSSLILVWISLGRWKYMYALHQSPNFKLAFVNKMASNLLVLTRMSDTAWIPALLYRKLKCTWFITNSIVLGRVFFRIKWLIHTHTKPLRKVKVAICNHHNGPFHLWTDVCSGGFQGKKINVYGHTWHRISFPYWDQISTKHKRPQNKMSLFSSPKGSGGRGRGGGGELIEKKYIYINKPTNDVTWLANFRRFVMRKKYDIMWRRHLLEKKNNASHVALTKKHCYFLAIKWSVTFSFVLTCLLKVQIKWDMQQK